MDPLRRLVCLLVRAWRGGLKAQEAHVRPSCSPGALEENDGFQKLFAIFGTPGRVSAVAFDEELG
jgi:hypothetical protein